MGLVFPSSNLIHLPDFTAIRICEFPVVSFASNNSSSSLIVIAFIPFDLGECYVRVDGADTDLVLVHYVRFLGTTTCVKNNITSVDILGFDYELGLFPTIQEESKSKGLRLTYKQIPMEVFDKRAVSKGEVIFHDVAYIGVSPIYRNNQIAIELTNYSVFYTQGITTIAENDLKKGIMSTLSLIHI